MAGFLVPLDTVAAEINARFRKATEIESKANDHRIAAGKLLIDARERVQGGEVSVTWEKWCAENVHRSQGDIRKVMRIAGHVEPAVAREIEIERNRVAKQRERADVSAVSQQISVKHNAVDELRNKVIALTPDEFADFKGWFLRYIGG